LSAFEQEDFAVRIVSQGLLSFGYDARSDKFEVNFFTQCDGLEARNVFTPHNVESADVYAALVSN
jgi:hypothetical protein